jgi:hypothetical protein
MNQFWHKIIFLSQSRDICIYTFHRSDTFKHIEFNCTQVCATTSRKVIACEREREIRVSANRGVDAMCTSSLTTSVRVEPFFSFLFVSRPDRQLNHEEIMHQPATTNFTLDAHALLLIQIHTHAHTYIYTQCVVETWKRQTRTDFMLLTTTTVSTTLVSFLSRQRRYNFIFRFDSEEEYFSLLLSRTHFFTLHSQFILFFHPHHLPTIYIYTTSNNIGKMLNCVYNLH